LGQQQKKESNMNDESKLPMLAPAVPAPLFNYDTARRALEAARTVDEVKAIRDEWLRVRLYAQQAKDMQLIADAIEIQMRAERRLGEMLEQAKSHRAKAGRPKKGSSENQITLPEAGIGKSLADRARKLATMTESEFETFSGERREQVLAKGAKPIGPRQQKGNVRGKVKRNLNYGRASVDLTDLLKNTSPDEQRLAMNDARLTDRRLLTIAPERNDDTGDIDYDLVEILKRRPCIDEPLIAAEAYDPQIFEALAEGFVELMVKRLGKDQSIKMLKA
jgi:hypothetical protein